MRASPLLPYSLSSDRRHLAGHFTQSERLSYRDRNEAPRAGSCWKRRSGAGTGRRGGCGCPAAPSRRRGPAFRPGRRAQGRAALSPRARLGRAGAGAVRRHPGRARPRPAGPEGSPPRRGAPLPGLRRPRQGTASPRRGTRLSAGAPAAPGGAVASPMGAARGGAVRDAVMAVGRGGRASAGAEGRPQKEAAGGDGGGRAAGAGAEEPPPAGRRHGGVRRRLSFGGGPFSGPPLPPGTGPPWDQDEGTGGPSPGRLEGAGWGPASKWWVMILQWLVC